MKNLSLFLWMIELNHNKRSLLSLFLIVLGVSVAYPQGKIYWTESYKINEANLDGTNRKIILMAIEAPRNIALDINAGKMYWTDEITNSIQKSNLDGSSIESIVEGLNDPNGIVVDVLNGKIDIISICFILKRVQHQPKIVQSGSG
jgi:hypothetical protein